MIAENSNETDNPTERRSNMSRFWNGNKSWTRQQHERDVLQALRPALSAYWPMLEDTTAYPNAEDEGRVFETGIDLLTTVAGNQKFAPGQFLEVSHALCGGILGCRVLVVRASDTAHFADVTETQLKAMVAGIPATWADADLLRQNGYQVLEKGSLEQMFLLLQEGLCDFIPLGINEAQSLLEEYPHASEKLAIEPSLMLYYPLPVVFYVAPQHPALHKEMTAALNKLEQAGTLQLLYEKHYARSVNQMNPQQRQVIELMNPALSPVWQGFQPRYLSR
ncbi:ABC transporter substrate-binding protein [Vibrio vulnificus]|uniref:transporter substrate-binding domain-containing protein n=1 Tax=Vibrio vulnificus TaxID=672 RepID=UPI000A206653|nr:transporter substrate-binding domain-containing protein [Vibrio vulnificus]ARN67561.1 ABC transporter substrate-binding protein [Vibrio vulnificus]